MSASAPKPATLAAAERLRHTQSALAAALRSEGMDGTDRPDAPASPASPSLIVQLADGALAPWAEKHPWSLMALAAGTGALLASRRGRGLVATVAMATLLAPAPGRRRGWTLLGHGLSLLVRLQRRHRPGP